MAQWDGLLKGCVIYKPGQRHKLYCIDPDIGIDGYYFMIQ